MIIILISYYTKTYRYYRKSIPYFNYIQGLYQFFKISKSFSPCVNSYDTHTLDRFFFIKSALLRNNMFDVFI